MPSQDETDMNETVARLESVMLESVLQRQPLPGRTDPVWFPDLAWITESPTVLVSDENIPDHLPITDTDTRVKVLPNAEIREAATEAGDRAYVLFQPPEASPGQIRITMEVRIAPAEPDIQPLGLGGISATFVESSAGEWTVPEPPAVFAM